MLWTAPPRHESAIDVGAVRTSHDSEEPRHAHDYDRRSRYREGTDRTRPASDLTPSRVSARHLQLRWWRASGIPRRFDWDGISRPGSGSYRSRTQAGVKTSSAASASKAIAIYAACSPQVRSP